MQQTFEQLKEANAKTEADTANQAEKLNLEEEAPADDPKLEVTPDASGTEGQGESDSEDWLAEPKGEADGQAVPLAAHIGLRDKLKGKLKDKDSELDKERQARIALEERLAKLESGKEAQPIRHDVQQLIPPDPLEFGTTAEFNAAQAAYFREVIRQETSLASQTQEAAKRQEAFKNSIEERVNAHYKRAEDFLKANNVSDERFQKAEITVRDAIESVFPGRGSVITDDLIAQVGEGSEVAILYAGLNEGSRAILINKLREDPRGLSALAYLSKLAVEKSKSRANSSSGAPAPAARVRGPNKGGAKVDAEALKKIYKAETKNGGYSQEAFEAKQRAKEAGVNTKDW